MLDELLPASEPSTLPDIVVVPVDDDPEIGEQGGGHQRARPHRDAQRPVRLLISARGHGLLQHGATQDVDDQDGDELKKT